MAAKCQIVNICGVRRRICRRANGTIKSSVAVGRTVKRAKSSRRTKPTKAKRSMSSKRRAAKKRQAGAFNPPRRASMAAWKRSSKALMRANAAVMRDATARARKRKPAAKSKRKGRATYTAVPTKVSSKFTCIVARVKGNKCVKVCHAKVGKAWREVSRQPSTDCK